MKKFMIVTALLVVMPSFAQAANRHHHENQYGEHRNAHFLGGLGIDRSISTDRESFVTVLGN